MYEWSSLSPYCLRTSKRRRDAVYLAECKIKFSTVQSYLGVETHVVLRNQRKDKGWLLEHVPSPFATTTESKVVPMKRLKRQKLSILSRFFMKLLSKCAIVGIDFDVIFLFRCLSSLPGMCLRSQLPVRICPRRRTRYRRSCESRKVC